MSFIPYSRSTVTEVGIICQYRFSGGGFLPGDDPVVAGSSTLCIEKSPGKINAV